MSVFFGVRDDDDRCRGKCFYYLLLVVWIGMEEVGKGEFLSSFLGKFKGKGKMKGLVYKE